MKDKVKELEEKLIIVNRDEYCYEMIARELESIISLAIRTKCYDLIRDLTAITQTYSVLRGREQEKNENIKKELEKLRNEQQN